MKTSDTDRIAAWSHSKAHTKCVTVRPRVPLDGKRVDREVIGGGIDLGNHQIIGERGEFVAQLVIDWGQILAMPTPRRVKLEKDVAGRISNKAFKGGTRHNLDVTTLV